MMNENILAIFIGNNYDNLNGCNNDAIAFYNIEYFLQYFIIYNLKIIALGVRKEYGHLKNKA